MSKNHYAIIDYDNRRSMVTDKEEKLPNINKKKAYALLCKKRKKNFNIFFDNTSIISKKLLCDANTKKYTILAFKSSEDAIEARNEILEKNLDGDKTYQLITTEPIDCYIVI